MLTKENKEEFLKIFEPKLNANKNINIVDEDDACIVVKHPFYTYHYKFGNLYVADRMFRLIEGCTEEEFYEEFELL